MNHVSTIKGKPIIEVFESFDGSYWYVIEKAWKQDSLVNGKIYKYDQIYYGYVRLSHCPQFAEWGYFSEAELKQYGPRIWKVHKCDWSVCPDVQVQKGPKETPIITADKGRAKAQALMLIFNLMKGGHIIKWKYIYNIN